MSEAPVKQTASDPQILNMSYPHEIEICQSKSGSNHVFILKSLKVRGDTSFEVVEQSMKAVSILKKNLDALNNFGVVTDENYEQYLQLSVSADRL
tara:strand:- start:1276 stop:1560 length:285 start_codon:yes stop_codon:yes gene_type:complete